MNTDITIHFLFMGGGGQWVGGGVGRKHPLIRQCKSKIRSDVLCSLIFIYIVYTKAVKSHLAAIIVKMVYTAGDSFVYHISRYDVIVFQRTVIALFNIYSLQTFDALHLLSSTVWPFPNVTDLKLSHNQSDS